MSDEAKNTIFLLLKFIFSNIFLSYEDILFDFMLHLSENYCKYVHTFSHHFLKCVKFLMPNVLIMADCVDR